MSALFGMLALTTGHMHWLRSVEQCSPITEPAARMIAKLPPTQRQHLVSMMDPAALLIGLARVAGPSVQVEIQALQDRKQGALRGPRAKVPPAGPAPGVPTGAPPDPGKVPDMTGHFAGAN